MSNLKQHFKLPRFCKFAVFIISLSGQLILSWLVQCGMFVDFECAVS